MSVPTDRPSQRPGQPAGGAGLPALEALGRAGFVDTEAVLRLLADAVLRGHDLVGLSAALAATPDPDRAVLALVRLLEAAGGDDGTGGGVAGALRSVLADGGEPRRRLLAVLGTSVALGDAMVRHPEDWRCVLPGEQDPAAPEVAAPEVAVRAALLTAVGADPLSPVPVADPALGRGGARDAMRRAHRRVLLGIVADDLVCADPEALVEVVAHRLSDLADAALEAALAMARALVPGHEQVALAVIALGKCGGQELNYVSDVDVVHVVAPSPTSTHDNGSLQEPPTEARVVEVGSRLARELALACSATTAEGTLWPVDTALRPGGRDGPLVRTLDSYLAHHRRWAATWELQAQLKARPAAGDAALGAAYVEAVAPLVWSAAERPGMVADTRAMRRRVEDNVPPADADVQLKLGRGGLRDVEFSVQLLQLVHARAQPALRLRGTCESIEALVAHGFVGRRDGAQLERDYRFLRVLEHRLQLHRLRRAQLLPRDKAGFRWLARASGVVGVDSRPDLLAQRLNEVRRRVRRLHERLFYQPLLEAVASLSTDEVRLDTRTARDRLEGLGYRDSAGALAHIAALTSGVSRRAAIHRQLLPVLMGWFADGSDPDAALLSFRRISERYGTSTWYLRMLRDESMAAARLARGISTSDLVAQGLAGDGEAVLWLGDDAALVPHGLDAVAAAMAAAVRRAGAGGEAGGLRGARTHEMLRTAMADVLGLAAPEQVRAALSDLAVAALRTALDVGLERVRGRAAGPEGSAPTGGPTGPTGDPAGDPTDDPTDVAVIGMGRLGGAEMGYGSDADVVVVHRPREGAPAEAAQRFALAVTTEMRKVLSEPGPGLPLELDTGLRPEGKNGPVARSLESCAAYYRRWSQPWESQALLRARPVAGDPGVGAAFLAMVDPLRYPAGGLDEAGVVAARRMKARVESERLPRGVEPRRHLKLGPGYLADVEWTAQLLQLRHAGEVEALRTTSTIGALRAAEAAGLLRADDAHVLVTAWEEVSRVRDVLVLSRGRLGDVLPTDPREAARVAHLLGLVPPTAEALDDHVRHTGRVARAVVERVFYG